MQKLEAGIHQFQANYFASNRQLFEQLAEAGQKPETLFITCCDSRVVPTLITSAAPGELFIIRNTSGSIDAVSQARCATQAFPRPSEYAGRAPLEVGNIIVCGHTNCGAIDAILNPESVAHLPFVSRWIGESSSIPKLIEERYGALGIEERRTAAVEENVLLSLERSSRFVQGRREAALTPAS